MTASGHSTPTKTCSRCKTSKPATREFFSGRLDMPIGSMSQCRRCKCELQKARQDAQRLADPEAVKANSKRNYARVADAQKAEKRALYAADPAKFSEKNKLAHAKNKERNNAQSATWYLENKERARVNSKKYYAKNKKYYLDGNKRRIKERRESDPVFAMRVRIRCLIYQCISRGGYAKTTKTQSVLGCDWDFFKLHIERQFLQGMSWMRMGEIHIDHIQPLSSAKTEADVIALNHFTNLRPMWAADNIAKSDTITHLI